LASLTALSVAAAAVYVVVVSWTPVTSARDDLESTPALPVAVESALRFTLRDRNYTRWSVPKHYVMESDHRKRATFQLEWFANNIAFRLIFSDDEFLRLHSAIVYCPGGNGLSYCSQSILRKPLDQLDAREAIYLEVMSHHPSKLKTEVGRQEIEQKTEQIFREYETRK
jgi:hypothetical protein